MGKFLLFSTSTELIRLSADTVVFVTADGNYSVITTVDKNKYVLTLQLGQVEKVVAEMIEPTDNRFVRIGKSLIINTEFITMINISRQKLTLSDGKTFKHELMASREALKLLKNPEDELAFFRLMKANLSDSEIYLNSR